MKDYVKPTIDVTAIASSAPIAAVTCTDMNDPSDWINVEKWDNGTFVGYVYDHGST